MKLKYRLRLVAISTVLFGGIIAAWIYFALSQPIGHGPAGPLVPREAFQRSWTQREVMLVGVGDSVTAGFGARKGYGYFDRLVKNPADEFPDALGLCLSAVLPKLQVTNLAVSGTTSIEHLAQQLPRLPKAATNVLGLVVVTTGGNDLIHNYGRTPPRAGAMYGATWEQAQPWIKDFEQRLGFILAELEARFPGGCHIFLATIYDPTDGVGDTQRAGLPEWKDGLQILEAYNNIIRTFARQRPNVHLVEFHSTFLGHGLHCTQFWQPQYDRHDPHYWYHVNLEDPNERGYDAIRRLFLIEMAKISTQLR